MSSLAQAAVDAILGGVAPRTLSSYLSSWKSFKEFLFLYNLPFPSLDVLTLSSFATHLHSVRKIKAASIQSYFSGINFMVKLASGSPCPALDHAQINLLMKGLKKSEPRADPSRQALTADLLLKCVSTLRSGYVGQPVDTCLEAMLLLGFFVFLRCAEFTALKAHYNPAIHASLSDISFSSPTTLTFSLKSSKTNQTGPAQTILLFKLDSALSPYETIHKHIALRISQGAGPSDPLFTNEANQIATRCWFLHHFRQILSRSGIDPSHFSGHSLRVGAATSASRSGISDRVIKQLGRWSSQAYALYIRNNVGDVYVAHDKLASRI